METDPRSRPQVRGERGGACPECKKRLGIEVPTIARRSKKTHELYFGCRNFMLGCRFNGSRSH
jgi:hypothetical protein